MQNSATQKDYATQNGYMGHVSTLTTRDTTRRGPRSDSLASFPVAISYQVWLDQLIGPLRLLLAKVPFIGMSATMTPSSASYITTSAHLRNPVRIYQNIARPNITIPGHKIQNGIHELNYLVPSTAFMIHQIPLGMVFADNINEGGAIARNLRTLLHPRLKARGDELIRVFNGDQDPLTRTTYLKDFQSGKTRIIIGTDALGMGIDIRQIRNVAQWKVSPILRLSILFQRFGRAGRDPTMSAFAKLFTQPIYVLENTTNAWLDANGIEDKILRTTMGDSLPPTLRNTNSPESNAKSYEIFKYLLTIPVDRIHSELNTKFQEAIRRHHQDTIDRLTSKVANRTKVDLFVVWVINNLGCRHGVFLLMFQDPDPYQVNPGLCCDTCHGVRDMPS